MRQWGGTGIIARIETPQIAKTILETGLPTIALDLSEKQLQPDHPLSRLSEVSSDSVGAARMAAEHLLERGFQSFAFVGIAGRVWSQSREQSFCEWIGKAGFDVKVYKSSRASKDCQWSREQPVLTEWLRNLPKPIGLMACNDDRGREVLEACRAANIHIPEELAVVGVDNDELLCDLADPPLSSVALNAEGTGFRTAAPAGSHDAAHATQANAFESQTAARGHAPVDGHCRRRRCRSRRCAPLHSRPCDRTDPHRRRGSTPCDFAA